MLLVFNRFPDGFVPGVPRGDDDTTFIGTTTGDPHSSPANTPGTNLCGIDFNTMGGG